MHDGKPDAEGQAPEVDFTERDWIAMQPAMAGHSAIYEAHDAEDDEALSKRRASLLRNAIEVSE